MGGIVGPITPATGVLNVGGGSDTDLTDGICKAFYVGGGGNVKIICGGTTVTLNGVQTGSVIPIQCSRIFDTDTTATGIIALY